LSVSLSVTAMAADHAAVEPFRLQLEAPIKTWDEAIPLGNGLTGGLLWGSENTVNLSLDRGDLWDERLPELYLEDNWNYDTIRQLKAAGNQAEISRLFDHPYNHVPYPTKLPGGRLVLRLAESQRAQSFELEMRQAVGRVALSTGRLECFFSAVQPVAMIRHWGPPLTYEFLRPGGLDKLGYQPAEFGAADGLTWMVQEAALGLRYAVVVAGKRSGDQTQLAVAITSNRTDQDPLAAGKQRVREALDAGFETLLQSHRRWWDDFWSISSATIPDPRLQRHYNLVKYFYGAASRPDAPPIPLQGVWTRDDGDLPPWKGDFHHDLNTQMTYLAYHTAGLTEAGLSFINYNWDLLPSYRKFAQDFYGVEGAAMPGVATLAGKPTAGWSQYALSPTNALWVGQSFHLHWRYTRDQKFLATRAYPWLSEVATGIVNLCQERDGSLYLPLSSSPEIHNNSLRAWLEPNSNYDLSLMHWTFEALAEMADELGQAADATHWREIRGKLGDLLVDDQNVLLFAKGEPFDVSHRHHSHTMAIHPLATLTVEGSDRDRGIIDATLDRMNEKGTLAWTGYSFSWFSCLAARAGRADEALRYLVDYERAFILRNGFHVNGDQIGAGLSHFRYRPFTLEGNFVAMEAVHDMLLQSWGGRVRVFPAVSGQWANASFADLRAEGGFRVSAERQAGRTVRVAITATVAGPLRLKNPFGEGKFQASLPCDTADGEIRCALEAGQTVTFCRIDER
jgi:alpha-L-fucosidase 2